MSSMFAPVSRTVFPMFFGRRHLEPLSDGSSTPLKLVRLQIEQRVNGNFPLIHQVATTMTFKNTHNIILEGAFEFTLPEQATICGYGLDVDGVIVDGVVVEKQAARIIFEKEVRKRIDPGFVELVTGNMFRTRVYPIEPEKTRTIRVIYQDQGVASGEDFQYQIPIQFQTPLESLDVVLTCVSQGSSTPSFLATSHPALSTYPQFVSKKNDGQYTAEWHLTNVSPSANGEQTLIYVLPGSLKPVLSAVETDTSVGAYFAVSCALPKPTDRRVDQLDVPSKTICLLWDASLSRSNAEESRLLELSAMKKIFDEWLTRFHRIEIILIVFRNDMEVTKLFQLQSGSWNDFLKMFADLPYDGATNLSQLSSINVSQPVDYYFLVSDCISTIEHTSIADNFGANTKAPIWIFNGNRLHEPYDIDFVRYLTQRNAHGGGYLNREKLERSSSDLLSIIETIQIKYVKLHSSTTTEQIYPSDSISIPMNTDRFLLVGQIPNPLPASPVQFELEFHLKDQSIRLPISLEITTDHSTYFGLIRRLWAQQKLAELNAFKEKYKAEILSLGLKYSVVSQFTSLLVLENLQQHLQYHVCPATSRVHLYNQYMQYHKDETLQKTNHLSELIVRWNERCQWYDRPITDIDRHRAYLPKTTSTSSINFVTPFGSAVNAPAATFSFGTSAATSAPSVPQAFGFTSPPQQSNFANAPKNPALSAANESMAISLNEYHPQSSFIVRVSSTSDRESAYLIYLNERTANRQSPSFYFDVASYFFSPTSFASVLDMFDQQQVRFVQPDQKSIDYGLRILTNILELELEAPQLYRTVGYKLMELKQWKLALGIFRKVYFLRSDEPQSLRDLALVLIELGEYEQALGHLKQILNQTWDARFKHIQTIVLSDFNRLSVLLSKTMPDIDVRLVRHLPVDIRIVVQWDTADTLVQVTIKEPTGQVCSNYAFSTSTDIGGYITNRTSPTEQPVEYMLRKAVNGRYMISVKYVSNAQHTLIGVSTVLITIYKHFGSPNEEKQIRTTRLTSIGQTVDVGYIDFGDPTLEKLQEELQRTKDECRRLQDQLMTSAPSVRQSSVQHQNVTCDGCMQVPIVGDRYKCLFCPNVDFCHSCQSSMNHPHPFLCIGDSSLYASSPYLQNISHLVHLNTQCTSCSVSPILGTRYYCVLCQINLCDKCEFLGLHPFAHQRLKIISPQ